MRRMFEVARSNHNAGRWKREEGGPGPSLPLCNPRGARYIRTRPSATGKASIHALVHPYIRGRECRGQTAMHVAVLSWVRTLSGKHDETRSRDSPRPCGVHWEQSGNATVELICNGYFSCPSPLHWAFLCRTGCDAMRDAYRATGTGDIQGPNRPTVTERETGTGGAGVLH